MQTNHFFQSSYTSQLFYLDVTVLFLFYMTTIIIDLFHRLSNHSPNACSLLFP